MLKIVLLISAIVAVALAGEPSPEFEAARLSCKTKFPNVTDDELKNTHSRGTTTTDENVKCYLQCISAAMGKSDAKGVFVKDAVLKQIPPHVNADKVKAGIDGCMALTGTTPCDTHYQQWQCLMKAAKAS